VGTTNRTRLADYERAIGERTRLLLRVHPSNFKVVGFTERPSLEELVELGRRSDLPVFEDLGSGCLADLSAQGISEPEAKKSLAAGATLVAFSGDKLLGGPQAGIIAGKKDAVERIRRNPLFRVLRVDKLTISVLEATLLAYLSGRSNDIPALGMIRMTAREIELRALRFVERLSSRPGKWRLTSARANPSSAAAPRRTRACPRFSSPSPACAALPSNSPRGCTTRPRTHPLLPESKTAASSSTSAPSSPSRNTASRPPCATHCAEREVNRR
jgi:L-seryl-tRNA(Ser) seleniumtransferase